MESRSKKSKRNMFAGALSALQGIIFSFISRTVIINLLGEQYVGLSSLFSSILSVLNMAELGFSTAIVVNLYKPLAENDLVNISSLLAYYKKIYTYVGLFILCTGIIITPITPFLIKGDYPQNINLYILYLLYLIDTSMSYFLFAYKASLLDASQRMDITKNIYSVISIFRSLTQILVIVFCKNFYYFVVVSIIFTILNNIAIAIAANKLYPEYRAIGEINNTQRKEIKRQVSGLMITNLSSVSRNSFDSIILSLFVGLTMVTIYNNYYCIYAGLISILTLITRAAQASVANSINTETREKNYHDMRIFQYIFSSIICVMTCCMLCIYQPFMQSWVGDKLMLPERDMILFVIYFYSIALCSIKNMYFSGNGLWWKAKKASVLEAMFNLLLNIGLGWFLGVTGVLISTVFTIVVFNFISKTNTLFREYFKRSPLEFYRDITFYTFGTFVCCMVTYAVCRCISFKGVLGLVTQCILSAVLGLLAFIVLTCKYEMAKPALKFIKQIVMA